MPGEVNSALERVRPLDLQVLRWNAATAAKDVQVTDEELQAAFQARATQLQVPEKRSVRYVLFALSPDEEKLEAKDRVGALQKIATSTGEFAEALAGGGDMAAVAGQKGLEVRTTPLFAPDGAASGALTDGDGEVVPASAPVAFRLPAGPGNYEIVQVGETGYAVIEVAAVEAARAQTFDEARADLRADLIAGKRDAALRESSASALAGMRTALSGGKTFAEAAKQAGLKPEKVEGLSVFDPDLEVPKRQLAAAALDLPAGTLGDFVPSPDGGFAVFVEERGATDEKTAAEQRPRIESGILEGKEMLLMAQWLATARQESGLEILRPLM